MTTQEERIDQADKLLTLMALDSDMVLTLFRGLAHLKGVQEITSALVPGCIPEKGLPPSGDQLRTYFLSLMIETGELVQELNWKPWKKDKALDPARIADEFADILAFLGVIMVYLDRLGVDPMLLAQAYNEKTRVNVSRFLGKVEGYGVKNE